MENHTAVWTPRIGVSRRAWTGRGMDGSLWIDVNGAPRAVGRDQYTVPTGYGTTSVARRLHSRSHAAHERRSFAPGRGQLSQGTQRRRTGSPLTTLARGVVTGSIDIGHRLPAAGPTGRSGADWSIPQRPGVCSRMSPLAGGLRRDGARGISGGRAGTSAPHRRAGSRQSHRRCARPGYAALGAGTAQELGSDRLPGKSSFTFSRGRPLLLIPAPPSPCAGRGTCGSGSSRACSRW
jgi:hypothetical protein